MRVPPCRIRCCLLIHAFVFWAIPAMAAGPQRNFYMATAGSDACSGESPSTRGTADPKGPVATLGRAVELSRKAGTSKPRTIVVAPGSYFLQQPIQLDARDEGLTIEAASGGQAVLYGGRRIAGWRPDGNRFWSVPLPDVAAGKWDFRVLVVNGRLAKRARLPKQGSLVHLTRFDVPWMSTTHGGWKRKPTQDELTTLKYRTEDLGPWLNVRNAEVTVYHMWDESAAGVALIDPATQTLRFSSPCGHPPGAFGVKKYVIWNVREGMSEPGQWYLDRHSGKVVYWPLPGEELPKIQAIAPTMESVFRVAGSPGKPVRDVTLRRLTIAVTGVPLRAGGFGAQSFDAAVSLRHAEKCRLTDLTLLHTGGQAIKADTVTGLHVENCHVHETGACGLIVRGSDCVISGNHIHHVGRMFPSAIGLSAGGKGGKGIQICGNEIHDTPYSAITCGGEDHRIEKNLVYGAMQELCDGAGIYITFCKRIVVRGNFLRDIPQAAGYGSSAYYLDEQAEDCLVEGNLALRVGTPSHNHMARKNTIRNNVFISDGNARLTFARCSDYRMENNVVWAKGTIVVTNPNAIASARNNIAFSESGKVEGVELADYRPAATGPLRADGAWLLAHPQITEYEKGVVRFGPQSPAGKQGIKPIDVSDAGRRASPHRSGQH